MTILRRTPFTERIVARCRAKTAVAILCAEIELPFSPEMETVEVFSLFVSVMADELRRHLEMRQVIAQHFRDTDDCSQALAMLTKLHALLIRSGTDRAALRDGAAALSDEIDPEPTERDLDIVDSLLSALRFGLDKPKPCQSRHAAHAGGAIFERIYAPNLQDDYTSWFKDLWMRDKFERALIERDLLPEPRRPLWLRLRVWLWWRWHDFRCRFWRHRVYSRMTIGVRRGDPESIIEVEKVD